MSFFETDDRVLPPPAGCNFSHGIYWKPPNSFSTVILFLKVLLAQQKLDQPFTGGVGSYKLYILVAHHIEKHLELGGCDRPGEVLYSFFFRYCGKQAKNSLRTHLSQDMVLNTSDGGSADLSNVFLLDHCVRLFEMCFERLNRSLRSDRKEGIGDRSLLSRLIDAARLGRERSKLLKDASAAVHRLKLSSPKSGQKRAAPCSSSAKSPPSPAPTKSGSAKLKTTSPRRDLEASEIIAGYDAQQRPSKKARRR